MPAGDVLTAVWFVLLLPLRLAALAPPIKDAVDRDIKRVLQPRHDLPLPDSYDTAELVKSLRHRPLRTLLYYRLRLAGGPYRLAGVALRNVYRGEPAMELICADIGPGLMFMHGFATIVNAKRIGRDCQISQQVTVGYSDRGGPPVLCDRVRIGANAVVLGPITLHDDAVVGAGAVVIDDVPPGKVVGGVPARVLEGATDRYSALKSK